MQDIFGEFLHFLSLFANFTGKGITFMPVIDQRLTDILSSGIVELSRGESGVLLSQGVQPETIREIHHILNIYSFQFPHPVFHIMSALIQLPSSKRGLLRLERFLKSAGNSPALPEDSRVLSEILAIIFSWSGALAGRLAGDSSLISLLASLENPLLPQLELAYYRNAIKGLIGNQNLVSEKIRAIHRMHTVQLIRICARNANPQTDISEISAELSLLAESVIETCLDIALEYISTKSGIPTDSHSLIVLGLGKLGGMELNVSSDIDLIYLYREPENQGNDDRITFHTLLAERLTRFLSEATDAGILYRVDTRLRADGTSGPLVRSTGDYFRYLEMRGEAWERQMLLKARPVAGNREAAGEFLRSVERFIFTTTITRSPNREIVALKNQIEARMIAEGSKKTHLKLMPGGIRDIEFIAQCLQLLMGGAHPEVRGSGNLPALDKLWKAGALSEDEHRILSGAYRRYRQTENALQWKELLPAFTLPGVLSDLNELAAFVGYESGEENTGEAFRREIEKLSDQVRAIYRDIFSPGGNDTFDEMAVQAALGQAGDEKESRFLESLGFPEPGESARYLFRLVTGNEPGGEAVFHPSVERFIPRLLRTLSNLPDPGGALERLTHIVDAYTARYTLFDILAESPRFMELLTAIAHGSLFLSDILVRDPSLLDWLVEVGEIRNPPDEAKIMKELRIIDLKYESNEEFTRSCLLIKNREKLRIGSRSITGLEDTRETFSNLAVLAECILKTVYERAFRLRGGKDFSISRDYAISVLTAGRLGAGVMDFGSDLDLIFVYRSGEVKENEAEISEYSVKLARLILSLITGGGGVNKLYDVDARLRPEGGNSVLAISFNEYRKYLDTRAVEWERLALVRARPVAGNDRLAADIESLVSSFVYNGRLTRGEIIRILDIRAKMTESSQKRHPGRINVKSGPGGLADIDFAAQAHAVHYGKEKPEIRRRETLDILKALSDSRLIDRHVALTLAESYRFLQDTEKALRIGSGRSVNTLPLQGVDLARAARLLGFRNVRRFRKRLEDVISLTQEQYSRLMAGLLDGAADGELQS
jgi:[glutamine synthetase] adenylyltransferase / [glutamine synthetase]-adenylyl-L-tyrosine phosphorylase